MIHLDYAARFVGPGLSRTRFAIRAIRRTRSAWSVWAMTPRVHLRDMVRLGYGRAAPPPARWSVWATPRGMVRLGHVAERRTRRHSPFGLCRGALTGRI